ncbi:hypothetical protein HDV03_000939 [Kappamyces sp. JEL0829]|nr:hypothetical protein HDV03_000939 [Kappamyces sp. JEL0829]KAJ3369801.1 hypothetical protein HDU91_006804 [Kappamyces sp. JEL0680]
MALRRQVIQLYKELLWIGREYPKGFHYFRAGLHRSFMKKAHLEDAKEIQKAIDHGRFVYKELEALWFLKKYRTMKARYLDREMQERVGLVGGSEADWNQVIQKALAET